MMILALLLKATGVLVLTLTATRLTRDRRASLRHVFLAASFATLLLLPGASALSPIVAVPVPAALQTSIAPVDDSLFIDLNEPPPSRLPSAARPDPSQTVWTPPAPSGVLSAIWIAGTVIFLLPVIVGLWKVRQLRRSGLPWRQGQQLVDRLLAQSAFGRSVEVLLHETLPGPMTYGIIRPAIVLPADARTWCSEDLDRALVHELAHVRRFDWLTQCCARVITAVYWLNPIVWIAWRQFALEAERACDDAVLCHTPRIGAGVDDTAYADQLVHLAQRLSVSTGQIHLAMANRRDLSARITAVLDSRRPRGRAGRAAIFTAAFLSVLCIAAISPLRLVARPLDSQHASTRQTQAFEVAPITTALAEGASGQSTAQQRYDVAAIKPCTEEENLQPGRARGSAGGTNASISPGRFSVPCVTLEQLVYLAYASYGASESDYLANDYMGTASDSTKVRGGPDWAHSHRDKWAIEATAPGVSDRRILMGTMLRTLLEERFKLKIRRGSETVPMYALRVAKGGLKLKPMAEDECDKRAEAVSAATAQQACGLMMRSGGAISRWHYVGFQLSFLARALSEPLGLHVVDETGVAGKFIIDFQFASDEMAGRGTGDPAGGNAAAGGPSIFTALEQQLGLKLEKITGPKGYLVIEHAERPAPDLHGPGARAGR